MSIVGNDIARQLALVDEQTRKLQIQKALTLEKALKSGSVEAIYKAETYLKQSDFNRRNFSSNFGNAGRVDGMKSIILDPLESASSMGYFSKNGTLSNSLLRSMARSPVISAILMTRKDQVAEFSKPQPDKYSRGFIIEKVGIEDDDELSDRDKKTIEELTDFILHCGDDIGQWEHDDFDAFLRKLTADSLTIDAATFEVVPNRGGLPTQFVATDGATFRLADTYDNNNPKDRVTGDKQYRSDPYGISSQLYLPSYVQLYMNQIISEFYPWELCYGIRNPSTNIYSNGYGRSELEDLVTTVTSMLNADKYNSTTFTRGSSPKGILMVKKGGVNKDRMAEMRRDWQSMVSGAENNAKTLIMDGESFEWIDLQKCLDRSTCVISKTKGLVSFENLLADSIEVYDELWDGKQFSNAHIFTTKPKQLCEVELYNRLKIKSSPNHRFLCLRNNETIWIEQRDLVVGDLLFTNKRVESTIDSLEYNGIPVEKDLLELMGWILGDGWIGADLPSKKMIKTFYHPEKELDIRLMHEVTCNKYGINFRKNTAKRTLGETSNGFTTIYSEYPLGVICDFKFYNWYRSLGFKSSCEKKVIPSILFQITSDLKCAFLRGFFSADGHISKSGSQISLTCANTNLRQQTIELLLSEGIRCCKTVALKKAFVVQDNDIFMQKVNFIQKYKRDREHIRTRICNGKDFYPAEFVHYTAKQLKDINRLKEFPIAGIELKNLLNISAGNQRATLSKVLEYADILDVPHPSFFDDYYLSPVIRLSTSDEMVEMVDVEMSNDNHAFYANGFIVHNSNKDMEYSAFQEYLIKLACAIYKISPEEIGFPLNGSHSGMGSKEGGKQEKDYSTDKGLKPLLSSIESWINKFIMNPKTKGQFRLRFVGLEVESATEEEERLIKAAAVYLTPDEIRKGKKMKPLPNGMGQMPLSPIMAQMAMGQQQQDQEAQQQQDEQDQQDRTNTNPFLPETDEDGNKDPFAKSFNDFFQKEFLAA